MVRTGLVGPVPSTIHHAGYALVWCARRGSPAPDCLGALSKGMVMNYRPPAQLQIQSTNDLGTANGIKAMVYGLAGSGKTRLAATMPRPIILSAENGLLSLKGQNVPYIQIHNLDELKQAYDQLLRDDRFWSVCLDSASEIAEVCLREYIRTNKDPRKAYGEMAQEILNVVRQFRDMPRRHVLFIMKQGRMKDEQTGGFLNGPLMPGNQLDQHMPYMFDECFQLVTINENGNIRSALRTQRDNLNEAKDRSGKLAMWEPPNMTHIINKIMA
jgi:hypothetical protein